MQMFSPFFKEQLFSTSWDLNVAGFTSVSFFKRKYTLEKITSVSNIKFDVTEKHEKRSLFVIKFRAQKSWGECAFAVLFWRWKTKLVSNYFFQWLVKSFHSLLYFQFLLKDVEELFLLPRKRIVFQDNLGWTWAIIDPKISSECDTQSKIQSILLYSYGKNL